MINSKEKKLKKLLEKANELNNESKILLEEAKELMDW